MPREPSDLPFAINRQKKDGITLSQAGRHEVRRLILAGSKVAAVARVRELTGAGLRQSKEYVDNLAAELGCR